MKTDLTSATLAELVWEIAERLDRLGEPQIQEDGYRHARG
jgi:hypothetical protein